MGLQNIPVHVATDLTPEQVRAYRIADNKTNEFSEWDMEILPVEIAELFDVGFDVKLLAFDDEELTQLLNAGMGIDDGLTQADMVPALPDEAIIRRGEHFVGVDFLFISSFDGASIGQGDSDLRKQLI